MRSMTAATNPAVEMSVLPTRTSLPQLERALDAAGIGYHSEASSLVYRTSEVRELLAAARAVDDPSDDLSLVTALRSPPASLSGGPWV